MPMTPGIMWMGSIGKMQWRGQELDPAGLFGLLKGMGLQTVDIFAANAEKWGLDTLKDALSASGLSCACYYIACDLVKDDPEGVAAADEAFVRGIENAQALGASICFTHGSQHGNQGDGAFTRYIERLGEKLRLFEGTGITLVIENAGKLMHTARDMKRVMDALADDGLRLCPDTGNFTYWGQNEVEAIEMLLPWSVHYHMKDFAEVREENGVPRGREGVFGEGLTPIDEIMDLIKGFGYEGVLAWEPGPQDEDGVEQSVRNLLAMMCD